MVKRKKAEMSPEGSADKEPARIDEAAVLPVPVEIPSSAVYQGSPMGDTLIKSLNAMIRQLLITTAEAKKILAYFDQSIGEVMEEKETFPTRAKDDVHAVGELDHFTNHTELWKLDATNVTITTGNRTSTFKRVRFVFE